MYSKIKDIIVILLRTVAIEVISKCNEIFIILAYNHSRYIFHSFRFYVNVITNAIIVFSFSITNITCFIISHMFLCQLLSSIYNLRILHHFHFKTNIKWSHCIFVKEINVRKRERERKRVVSEFLIALRDWESEDICAGR